MTPTRKVLVSITLWAEVEIPLNEKFVNEVAPEGQIFVCGACGKRSRDLYGLQKVDSGWDESCMLNSILCYDPPGIKGWKAVEE